MKRTPPTWTEADSRYYGDAEVCMVCGEPMKVGDPYWLNRNDMMREPARVFHAKCRKP